MGLSALGLSSGGLLLLGAPLFVFALVPLVELFTQANHINVDPTEEQVRRKQHRFDMVLGVVVLAYAALWVFFVRQVLSGAYSGKSLLPAAVVMGLSCGGIGINLGHELGHRKSRFAQRVAKAMLASSL